MCSTFISGPLIYREMRPQLNQGWTLQWGLQIGGDYGEINLYSPPLGLIPRENRSNVHRWVYLPVHNWSPSLTPSS